MMPDIAKVHYSNRVMKQIFAKQILNKEYMSKITDDNEQVRNHQAIIVTRSPATADNDLLGKSIHTDDSMSKFMRQDGSPIRNSNLRMTKGNAPSEFNKHTFGKNITLKYDNTKFRPEFTIAPTQDATSIIDQELQQNASVTMDSVMWPHQSISSGTVANKHMHHRDEDIHRSDSRPFLKDPKWPRDDLYASFTCFRDKATQPEVSIRPTIIFFVILNNYWFIFRQKSARCITK